MIPFAKCRSFRLLIILSTLHIFSTGTSTVSNEEDGDVQELYITQRLDHFDNNNDATYQQRYFVSYRYHKYPRKPIASLLCVGGEGPGFTERVLTDSVHCSGDMIELAKRLSDAKQYNVHLYALEHRYYGSSYPIFQQDGNNETTSPLSVQNMRYLSSRQALEDLAHFVHSINQETDETGNTTNTWITFGGSYPGLLSMYARYKYPHLIYAAVSSSAPVQLEVDFPGYKAQQGWDLQYEKVGGSMQCHSIVTQGHRQAVALLHRTADNGPLLLANKFNVCNPDTALQNRRNQELLLGDGLVQIPAQSNDPSCTTDDLCNIATLCEFMVQEVKMMNANEDDDKDDSPPTTDIELEVLVKVAHKQSQYEQERSRSNYFQYQQLVLDRKRLITPLEEGFKDEEDCRNVDFEDMLKYYSSDEKEPFGYRSWLWQTCTEFGFYQTCLDDCPFAPYYHQVDMDLEICSRIFNITNVYDNIQSSLDHYGGKDFVHAGASNILFINGNVDPWAVLGLQENDSTNYKLPVKIVAGASHHFWTHAVKDTDAIEIIAIREYIYSCAMDWLGINNSVNVM